MEDALKKLLILSCLLLIFAGCSSNVMNDVVIVKSSGYGYSADSPVACGRGIDGEMEYLSKLRGPDGQQVHCVRMQDCCPFRIFPSGEGYLSRWELSYEGISKPVILYINTFVRAPVRAPNGFAFAE